MDHMVLWTGWKYRSSFVPQTTIAYDAINMLIIR